MAIVRDARRIPSSTRIPINVSVFKDIPEMEWDRVQKYAMILSGSIQRMEPANVLNIHI
jgi:hypothetical protein